ncbi:unnamed protein product [Eruca vesicaria subsp. sativa]|uniref:NYN domain-containing protein n=1 Tax=Eruca vesicaria subsp. sativa TaxID=29727 RepID=A0ABC8KJF1_ERUVS|nr:unnamed protein product [Eruca vesicaria subsp. sativa]
MHAGGWTGVFWDMDDFPLPPGLDLNQFVKNVELAIFRHGIRCDVEFYAFGSSDSFDFDRYVFTEGSFTAYKFVDKRTRFYRCLHTILRWIYHRKQYGGVKNVLYIAKGIPGEDNDNMDSFFDQMIERGHNVLTVVPDGTSPENFDYLGPISAWYWSDLCSGGTAIADLDSSTDDDSDSGSDSPETDRAQGVKRASETDAAAAAKSLQKSS